MVQLLNELCVFNLPIRDRLQLLPQTQSFITTCLCVSHFSGGTVTITSHYSHSHVLLYTFTADSIFFYIAHLLAPLDTEIAQVDTSPNTHFSSGLNLDFACIAMNQIFQSCENTTVSNTRKCDHHMTATSIL